MVILNPDPFPVISASFTVKSEILIFVASVVIDIKRSVATPSKSQSKIVDVLPAPWMINGLFDSARVDNCKLSSEYVPLSTYMVVPPHPQALIACFKVKNGEEEVPEPPDVPILVVKLPASNGLVASFT